MLPTLNGIKTCDTCRKAAKTLEAAGRAHRVRDLRDDALKAEEAGAWLDQIGADRLVNRRSTTWRGLSEEARGAAGPGADPEVLLALLAEHPTLIKRPVFQRRTEVLVGFDHAVRSALAGSSAPNQDSLRHA